MTAKMATTVYEIDASLQVVVLTSRNNNYKMCIFAKAAPMWTGMTSALAIVWLGHTSCDTVTTLDRRVNPFLLSSRIQQLCGKK